MNKQIVIFIALCFVGNALQAMEQDLKDVLNQKSKDNQEFEKLLGSGSKEFVVVQSPFNFEKEQKQQHEEIVSINECLKKLQQDMLILGCLCDNRYSEIKQTLGDHSKKVAELSKLLQNNPKVTPDVPETKNDSSKTLKESQNPLLSQLELLFANIGDMIERNKRCSTKMVQLEEKQKNLEQELMTLKTSKDTRIDTIDQTLINYGNTLTDHTDKINYNASSLRVLTKLITNYTGTLNEHTNKLADLTTAINDHTNTIKTLTNTVTNHTNTLTDNTNRLNAVERTLTNHATTLNNHSSTMSTLDNALHNHEHAYKNQNNNPIWYVRIKK